MGGIIYFDFGNATNQTSNRMTLYEYSPKSTPDADNTGYAEGYRLPAPTAGLTANANYDILTTKNAVTVAQGGTGATTVAGARNALGLGNTSGAVPVANGGTGATSAADARTNLGLGAAATRAVANNLTTTASGSVLDARQGKTLSDKITSLETYSTGSITSKTGFTSDLWIKKIAGVVCINGYITATNAFGASQTEVGTLAEGYRPQYNVRMLVGLSDAAYNAPKGYAYVGIDTAGKVYITANSGNTYKICYFNASFVAYS